MCSRRSGPNNDNGNAISGATMEPEPERPKVPKTMLVSWLSGGIETSVRPVRRNTNPTLIPCAFNCPFRAGYFSLASDPVPNNHKNINLDYTFLTTKYNPTKIDCTLTDKMLEKTKRLIC